MKLYKSVTALLLAAALGACASKQSKAEPYPKSLTDVRNENVGKILGHDIEVGVVKECAVPKPVKSLSVAVNPYMWRASLEVLSKSPLMVVDPATGVISTDWYISDNSAHGMEENYKLNVLVLSGEMRADGIKVTGFRRFRRPGEVSWQSDVLPLQTTVSIEKQIIDHAKKLKLLSAK